MQETGGPKVHALKTKPRNPSKTRTNPAKKLPEGTAERNAGQEVTLFHRKRNQMLTATQAQHFRSNTVALEVGFTARLRLPPRTTRQPVNFGPTGLPYSQQRAMGHGGQPGCRSRQWRQVPLRERRGLATLALSARVWHAAGCRITQRRSSYARP